MSVEALLFDLGGVVVEIDFGRAIAAWARAAGVRPEQLASRFTQDAAYERHERGEIDGAQYFESLRQSLGLALTDAQLTDGWNAIYVREVPGIRTLLQSVTGRIPVYAFTNSNPTHQAYFRPRYAEVLQPFRKIFDSCEMGLRKPEAPAFRAISQEIGVPLDRILFFDDTAVNVDAAAAIGMPAVLVRSIDDVRKAVAAL
jgi:HAD superfamily hydrolase (TIGR01509 family)